MSIPGATSRHFSMSATGMFWKQLSTSRIFSFFACFFCIEVEEEEEERCDCSVIGALYFFLS